MAVKISHTHEQNTSCKTRDEISGGKGGTIPRVPDHHGSCESLQGRQMSAGTPKIPTISQVLFSMQ